jgi:hypothetical protein
MSRSKTLKYVLCRPQGGLNDMLCQIVRTCVYGQRFGRKVIIDTAYENSSAFRDKFSRYFVSKFDALIFNPTQIMPALNYLSVYPRELQDRLQHYKADWFNDGDYLVEDETKGVKLTFDFERDYEEQLIVHHSAGGGKVSFEIPKFLHVHKDIVDLLEQRLLMIGPNYDAIHIRHTDIETEYASMLEKLKRDTPERLFVATDNVNVLNNFRTTLGSDRVFSFTEMLSTGTDPIHRQHDLNDTQRFRSNADAIVDLLTLAFAKKLILLETTLRPGKYSGYGLLAQHFHEDREALRSFLNNPDLPY